MRETEYSEDERRVSDYLQKITKGQVGSGDDPIGFLIASHDMLRRERDQWRKPMVANKFDPNLRKFFLLCLRPAAYTDDNRAGFEIDDLRDWDGLSNDDVNAMSIRHRLNPEIRAMIYCVEPGTAIGEVERRVKALDEKGLAHLYESAKNLA